MNSLQQQARFDAFMDEFNTERPHEGLDIKTPAQVYLPSTRPYSVVGDNYLGRSTTTILAGFAPVPGRCGRRGYRELLVIERRLAFCPARRSRTTKCKSTSNTT
jgi:hypothetical protein